MKDVKIYRFNPKYNYIKHKWAINFVIMILPMYLKQDAIIKDISQIKANEIYYVFCEGVWNLIHVDNALSFWGEQ